MTAAVTTAQPVILVNGEPSASVPADDRGFLYGDGVFRTLRMVAGKPRWWLEQIAKLSEDASRIGLAVPDPAVWWADLEQIPAQLSDGVLKLILTRGSGRRGYLPPTAQPVRRLMVFEATPADPNSGQPRSDLCVRICTLRLGWQPRLAGIKHMNRLENVLARGEWSAPDIHEGLMLDHAERVISGVMSNLFIWRRNRLLTPRLDQCGVAGVTRGRLLRLASERGMDVEETELSMQAVFEADEVMLTNSVAGLRRVARLESKSWPDPVISPRLVEWLDA
jgi:4-amino-4-deoxychorismate lyase